MSCEEIQASLLLNMIPGMKPARFQSLVQFFKTARDAAKADPEVWAQAADFEQEEIDRIKQSRSDCLRLADRDWEMVQKEKVQILLSHDGVYPALLKEIQFPPPVLYFKGQGLSEERPAIALVGSRHPSYYGEQTAKFLSKELSETGIVTVSGLARGIDSCVHEATVAAQGVTWAVIGSGLAVCYPPENRKLAARIQESGAVISEFPMYAQPLSHHFPRRNRIIAGLAKATVVIEGREKSGSLITARLAADMGREVMAVPGPINSVLSFAPHFLIQSGAKLVTCAQDVLEELGLGGSEKLALQSMLGRLPREGIAVEGVQDILDLLEGGPCPREIITEKCGVPSSQLAALMLELELAGLVRTLPGGQVVKCW